jgi:hypothetical protein
MASTFFKVFAPNLRTTLNVENNQQQTIELYGNIIIFAGDNLYARLPFVNFSDFFTLPKQKIKCKNTSVIVLSHVESPA